jgi:hypothetical protein
MIEAETTSRDRMFFATTFDWVRGYHHRGNKGHWYSAACKQAVPCIGNRLLTRAVQIAPKQLRVRDAVQFKRLDVRHRPRLSEARDRVDPRAGASADHDVLAAESARRA